MSPETREALEESIELWRRNASDPNHLKLGSDHCPLCNLFLEIFNCNGCPIYETTALRYCRGTPYHKVLYEKDPQRIQQLCEEEHQFLRNLLP